MRECDVGVICGGGAEGEGERGDAGFDADGFALVDDLSVLKSRGAEKGVRSLCCGVFLVVKAGSEPMNKIAHRTGQDP